MSLNGILFKDAEDAVKDTGNEVKIDTGFAANINDRADDDDSENDDIDGGDGMEETLAPESSIKNYNYSRFLNETLSLQMYIEYLRVNDFYNQWKFNTSSAGAFRRMLVRRSNSDKDMFLTKYNSQVGNRYGYTSAFWTKFKITPAMMNAFPMETPPNLGSLHRCAVVGPNEILKNTSCGKEIDKADFVFRYNFNTPGKFTPDIGCKSNLTIIGPSVLKSRFQSLQEVRDRKYYIENATALKGYLGILLANQGMASLGMKARRLMKNETLFFNPVIFRDFKTILTQKYNYTRMLSMGMFTSLAALSMCKEVHLYGIWPFRKDYKGVPVPFYYSEEQRTYHSIGEYKILRDLHEQGGLRLHLGPCT
ncbi:alpha-N-acetylneuraminide alpha-2,8-sialyltransferase-like isoform X2 [Ptychodera flava]